MKDYFTCLNRTLDASKCNFDELIAAPKRKYKHRGDGRRDSKKNFKLHCKYIESFNLIKFYETDEYVIYAGNAGTYPRDPNVHVVTFDITCKHIPFHCSDHPFQYFYIQGQLEDIRNYIVHDVVAVQSSFI